MNSSIIFIMLGAQVLYRKQTRSSLCLRGLATSPASSFLTSTYIGVEGGGDGSHGVAGKHSVKNKNSQLASLVQFSAHISRKADKSLAKLISQLCHDLPACLGETEAYQDYPGTDEHPTSLRNKLQ